MLDVNEINRTIIYLKCYITKRFNKDFDPFEFIDELFERIAFVLIQWSGDTYVGEEKTENIKKIFQDFFITLVDLVNLFDKNKEKCLKQEIDFSKNIKYKGTIYRILGYSNCLDRNKNKSIIPKYNDIYVSWSKNKDNSYLESKLYGKKTRLTAVIDKDKFGIDLEKIEEFIETIYDENLYISRGNEREVVFPTLEECVKEVIYE